MLNIQSENYENQQKKYKNNRNCHNKMKKKNLQKMIKVYSATYEKCNCRVEK